MSFACAPLGLEARNRFDPPALALFVACWTLHYPNRSKTEGGRERESAVAAVYRLLTKRIR